MSNIFVTQQYNKMYNLHMHITIVCDDKRVNINESLPS